MIVNRVTDIAPSPLLGWPPTRAQVAAAALTPDAPTPPAAVAPPPFRPTYDDLGAASAAMSWAMQGRLQQSRQTLRRLPPGVLREVALAAELVRGAAAAMAAVHEDTVPLPAVPPTVEVYPIAGGTR